MTVNIPKKESEQLLNELLPFAKLMLKENREFYPYGGYLSLDGKITHVGAEIKETDNPKSSQLIELLTQSFQEKVCKKECRASAIIFDVRITPPGTGIKTDAIQVCLDHVDGYSAEVVFPYRIADDGELIFGETFAQRRERK